MKLNILKRSRPSQLSRTDSMRPSIRIVNDFCRAKILCPKLAADLPRSSERYAIPMSHNPHDLLLQWLSGAGLDDEWESGLHSSAGRAKEAVKAIITSRLTLTGMLFPRITISGTA